MEESQSPDSGDVSGELEPEVHRVGHLVFQAVINDKRGKPNRLLFKCDCGKLVRIPVLKFKRGQSKDACSKCWKPPPKKRGRKRESCRLDFPSEYNVWRNIKFKARGKWRTCFNKFFRDMGPMPQPGLSCCRHDLSEPYYPSNCYWGRHLEDRVKQHLYFDGIPKTPGWITSTFGVRRPFIVNLRSKGIIDVREILRLWKEQHPDFELPPERQVAVHDSLHE